MALSSYVTAVWQLYLTYGVIGGMGSGAFWVTGTVMVMGWFKDERAMNWAVSIVALGTGTGTMFVAPLGGFLITTFGWRSGYAYMALFVWTIVAVVIVLVKNPKTSLRREKSKFNLSSSLSQIKTKVFVCLLLSYSLVAGMARQDLMLHVVSFLGTRNFTYSVGVMALALVGLGNVSGRFFSGALSEKIGEKIVLPLCFLIQALSTFAFLASPDVLAVYFASFLFGIAYGGSAPQIPLILRKIFGTAHFGTIFGLVLFGVGVGAVIGPTFIGGYLYDLTQNYIFSFLVDGLIPFVALILIFVSFRES